MGAVGCIIDDSDNPTVGAMIPTEIALKKNFDENREKEITRKLYPSLRKSSKSLYFLIKDHGNYLGN